MIKNDTASLGVFPNRELAMAHAAKIMAKNVRVIGLYKVSSQDPLGFLIVPGNHRCFACGQHVDDDYLGRELDGIRQPRKAV